MKKLPPPVIPVDSPLPAWNHYEITRMADLDIQEQLPEKKTHKEFLIGLEVAYAIPADEAKEETYISMAFGKVQVEPARLKPQKARSSLTPDFLDELYNKIRDYILSNIGAPNITLRLQVMTNKAAVILTKKCLAIGSTNQGLPVRCSGSCGNGAKRWCKKTRTAWVCTHSAC